MCHQLLSRVNQKLLTFDQEHQQSLFFIFGGFFNQNLYSIKRYEFLGCSTIYISLKEAKKWLREILRSLTLLASLV